MTFFALGASWSALCAEWTIERKCLSNWPILSRWLQTSLYCGTLVGLLATLHLGEEWITNILVFFTGCFLWDCLLDSINTCLDWVKHTKNAKQPQIFASIILAIALLVSAFGSWIADRMYFTNRNVDYWITIIIAATGGLVIFSTLIQTCLKSTRARCCCCCRKRNTNIEVSPQS